MAGGKVGASGITCLKIWSLSREGIMVRRVDENDVQTSVHQVMQLPWASPGTDQQLCV